MPHLGPAIFDNTNPLIVTIEPDANGVWQVQPSKTDTVSGGPANGSIHRDIATGRALEMKPVTGPAWTSRRAAGAPVDPTYFHSDHVPMVLISGEKVKFKCARPFTIWFDRDPNVSIVSGSPQIPLDGVTLPVNLPAGVSGPFNVLGCGQQLFYKCTAYVDLGGGQTLVIDPDSIIDF